MRRSELRAEGYIKAPPHRGHPLISIAMLHPIVHRHPLGALRHMLVRPREDDAPV